jgi:hypothetical protein
LKASPGKLAKACGVVCVPHLGTLATRQAARVRDGERQS